MDREEYLDIIGKCKAALAGGASIDSEILFMKQHGFSPIGCVKGVMELTGLSLREASLKVFYSEAGRELRE